MQNFNQAIIFCVNLLIDIIFPCVQKQKNILRKGKKFSVKSHTLFNAYCVVVVKYLPKRKGVIYDTLGAERSTQNRNLSAQATFIDVFG